MSLHQYQIMLFIFKNVMKFDPKSYNLIMLNKKNGEKHP